MYLNICDDDDVNEGRGGGFDADNDDMTCDGDEYCQRLTFKNNN